MFKSNLFKIIRKSIKFISTIIFLFIIAIIFITISKVNIALENKIIEQNKYTSFIKENISDYILTKRKILDLNKTVTNFSNLISNLEMSIEPTKKQTEQIENEVTKILFGDMDVEVIKIGNYNFDSEIIIKSNDDFVVNSNLKSDSWTNDEYGRYNVDYVKDALNNIKLIVDIPLTREQDVSSFSSMQINIKSLLKRYTLNIPERILILDNNGVCIYSEDSYDVATIDQLINMYAKDFFNLDTKLGRNKKTINVSDLHYYDKKIITASRLDNNFSLVILKDYNKFSALFVKDQLLVSIFGLWFFIFGVIWIVIFSTRKTETWINTEKQSLSGIIDSDRINIIQLKNELGFYKDFISDSKNPIVTIDRENNRIFKVNQAALNFYLYSEEDMLELTFEEICEVEFDLDLSDESILLKHKKSDFSREERSVKFQTISFNENEMVVMIVMSERIMSDEVYFDARAELLHEIRSPLQGAYGANDMIEKATDNYGEYTSIIKKSIANVLEITNNILASEKISSDKEKLQVTEFNLVELVNEVISTIVFQDSHYNQIKGVVRINEDDIMTVLDDYMIKTDIIKLRHILINILSNGSKYTNQGLVTLNVEVKKLDGEENITFKVSDTGKGFGSDELTKMYDKFTTFGTKEKNISSSGLGLGVARKYVEFLGSELDVHSKLNIGSIFTFALKLESNDIKIKKNISSKSILIVDDDETSCDFLKHFFEKIMKCRVKTLTNETHVFEELNHFEYDCVLMDQNLNHFNGVDIIRLIRSSINKRIANVPIILMSAVRSKHEIGELSDVRISDVIIKPFDNDEIKRVVERIF